jgi:Tol biopolymer transport system component
MNYLGSNKLRILIGLIAIFLLFQAYKFIKIRITNIDLPKGRIVFSSGVDGDKEIYTMDINGANLKQLTRNSATRTNTATDYQPSFSPNGEKIVFVSDRQGENKEPIYDYQNRIVGVGSSKTGALDIYIMNSDGSDQAPLTYHGLSLNPFFSPDGRYVVFETKNNMRRQKMIVDYARNDQRMLNRESGQCSFSPDGKKIYDTFQCDLSAMDVNGANRVRLTKFLSIEESIKDPRKRKVFIQNIAFSHDAKKLVFVLSEAKEDFMDGLYDLVKFYNINIDGSNLEEICRIDCLNLNWPYISKDNEKIRFCNIKQILYSADDKAIIFIADFNYFKGIYSLDLISGSVEDLTYKKQNWRDIIDFVFTPDGKKMIFIADIYPKYYSFHAVILYNIRSCINYYLFRKSTPPYDNKYLCVMDMDGKNYQRIVKLPDGTEAGHDFIHWE